MLDVVSVDLPEKWPPSQNAMLSVSTITSTSTFLLPFPPRLIPQNRACQELYHKTWSIRTRHIRQGRFHENALPRQHLRSHLLHRSNLSRSLSRGRLL